MGGLTLVPSGEVTSMGDICLKRIKFERE